MGIIAILRHFEPPHTLLGIYRSLIYPYLSYRISAWGQATQIHLSKLLTLQKRVLRLMHFADNREHAIPIFIATNIMAINMLYCEAIANLMHNISNKYAPPNIIDFFTKLNNVHTYNTRSLAAENFYVNHSRLELQKHSFSKIGLKLWNSLPVRLHNLRKPVYKNELH